MAKRRGGGGKSAARSAAAKKGWETRRRGGASNGKGASKTKASTPTKASRGKPKPAVTKARASDLKFQRSGKGGGMSVQGGRAAKAAWKAKDAARRLRNQERNNSGARRWTAGSQKAKQAAARRAARGTGYAPKRAKR